MKPAPLTLDTLQSKTAEFDSVFFFPNQHIVNFFILLAECEDQPVIRRSTSGRGSGQLSCFVMRASKQLSTPLSPPPPHHHHLHLPPLWRENWLLGTNRQRAVNRFLLGPQPVNLTLNLSDNNMSLGNLSL